MDNLKNMYTVVKSYSVDPICDFFASYAVDKTQLGISLVVGIVVYNIVVSYLDAKDAANKEKVNSESVIPSNSECKVEVSSKCESVISSIVEEESVIPSVVEGESVSSKIAECLSTYGYIVGLGTGLAAFTLCYIVISVFAKPAMVSAIISQVPVEIDRSSFVDETTLWDNFLIIAKTCGVVHTSSLWAEKSKLADLFAKMPVSERQIRMAQLTQKIVLDYLLPGLLGLGPIKAKEFEKKDIIVTLSMFYAGWTAEQQRCLLVYTILESMTPFESKYRLQEYYSTERDNLFKECLN